MIPTCDNPHCGKPNMIGVDRCEWCGCTLVTEILERERMRLIERGIHIKFPDKASIAALAMEDLTDSTFQRYEEATHKHMDMVLHNSLVTLGAKDSCVCDDCLKKRNDGRDKYV